MANPKLETALDDHVLGYRQFGPGPETLRPVATVWETFALPDFVSLGPHSRPNRRTFSLRHAQVPTKGRTATIPRVEATGDSAPALERLGRFERPPRRVQVDFRVVGSHSQPPDGVERAARRAVGARQKR